MRKTLFLLYGLFALATIPQKASAQLLWKISGNGLKKPSWLYGTMHVSDPRVLALSKQAWEAFDQADMFAGELKPDPTMLLQLMGFIMMKGDTTLSMLYEDPAHYAEVRELIAEKLGAMAPMAERLQPVFISILLNDYAGAKEGGTALDLHLMEKAEQAGKKVVGLEKAEEQMAVFSRIPLRRQAEMLLKELRSGKSPAEETEKLIALYASQDLEEMYRMVKSTMEPEMQQEMLVARNQRMAERLSAFMKQQSVFAGVGAAHLPGSEGMIELLKRQGYRVKPVR